MKQNQIAGACEQEIERRKSVPVELESRRASDIPTFNITYIESQETTKITNIESLDNKGFETDKL